MTSTRLYLGVDGGGTKTEFVCIDDVGKVIAHAVTETTYHLQVGVDGAIKQLHSGLQAIRSQLAIQLGDIDFIFFGLPAYGEDAQIDPQLLERCGQTVQHERFACGNDMICGWAGSLACADGINLVAGTGSIGYGERRGRAARAGGWGEIFSDEGSAYWIAIQGLNAFTRMSDGRIPLGAMHRLFIEALGLKDDIDICARIMGACGMKRDEIAGLAPIISRAANDGDPAATGILDNAATELLKIAVALRTRLSFAAEELAPLSWSGGVLAKEALLRGLFVNKVEKHGGFHLKTPAYSPAYGAALYAKHLSGRNSVSKCI